MPVERQDSETRNVERSEPARTQEAVLHFVSCVLAEILKAMFLLLLLFEKNSSKCGAFE